MNYLTPTMHRTPLTMQLDTHFQLPKFIRKMNGETVHSWIRSLSTYFKTSPKMEESTKLQIANLQLEGIAQTWWDTQLEQFKLVMELGTPQSLKMVVLLLGMLSVMHCMSASIPQAISRIFSPSGCSSTSFQLSLYKATLTSSASCTYISITTIPTRY
jgi:hypothetical protein